MNNKKENKKDNLNKKLDVANSNDNFLQKNAVDVGGSIVGAIVGIALGGPIGAIVGASTAPVMTMTYKIVERAFERRYERTRQIVEQAFIVSRIAPEEAIFLLNSDDDKVDDFLSLLRIVLESDPSVDKILSSILAESLISKSNQERERLLIIGDALRNIRPIHIRILKTLYDSGGILKSNQIASVVGIPEIELRSVVRDLELRGMIKDLGNSPVEWKLRELGDSLISYVASKEN